MDEKMYKMRAWICSTARTLSVKDRETLTQFLSTHLRDKNVAKECADGTRINLDILSDDIIRIIYNYIRDTIIKDGNGV